MAFDYRNFGDSEGSPREEVDHCGQIEDWQSAIGFATTLADTRRDGIGIWGTSLGGRNVLAVAALDRRVKCVVAQVPAITVGPALEMRAMMATGSSDVTHFFRALEEDRRNRALGQPPRYIHFENDPTTEHGSYWATFGEKEKRNWKLRKTLRSLEPTLADDISPLMNRISPTPLRMILTDHDTACPTAGQLEMYSLALEPKSLMVLPGHHYALYTVWKDAAIAAAREWFVAHLKPEGQLGYTR